MQTLEKLWEDVELAVCRVCFDHAQGQCRIGQAGRCALKSHFGSVVDAISSVTSATYPPYVKALRTGVCDECEHQIEGGRCTRRERVECALDRYYPLIIDAIEEGLYGNPISLTMARR